MTEKRDLSPFLELDKEQLVEMIFALQAEIQQLKEQLAKNSRNSSKPPSSDGMKKPPKTKSLREKGKRASGGQVGHEGKTLCQVEVPDHVLVHEVESCPHCQTELQAVAVEGVEKRQVFDIPPVKVEVTEHQTLIKACPCCGKRVKAEFPEAVRHPVQYGERLKGQIAYLSVYQLLPLARLRELLQDSYGVAMSEGTLLAILQEMKQCVQPSIQAIREQLVQAEVVHVDETGMRVAGRLHWCHVVGTKGLTHYAVHRKHGQVAVKAIDLVAKCRGWLVHDAYATYFTFQHLQHALCNAHLLRELTFLAETQAQEWAGELKTLLLTIKSTLAQSSPLSQSQVQAFQQQYVALLEQGWQINPLPDPPPKKPRGKMKKSIAQNLLTRLSVRQEAVLAFMEHPEVPFDNNLAERDLRMLKVRQKISGCFRTERGAETFATLRSYISTIRKQSLPLLSTLTATFAGQPFIPSPA